MSKGGGQQTSTVNQTNLPEYAEPYVERLFDRAETESQRPYEAYTGDRFTDPGTFYDVERGRDIIRSDTVGEVPYSPVAKNWIHDLASIAYGVSNLDPTEYSTTHIRGTPNYNADRAEKYIGDVANYEGYDPNMYQFQGAGTYKGDNLARYMSPYMQNVVDVEKDYARRDFAEDQQFRDAQATQAGAFGGSRGAVVDSLAQRDLSDQLAAIQARGQEDAFTTGAGLFEADRAARMGLDQTRAGENARYDQLAADEAARAAEIGLSGQQLAGNLWGADINRDMTVQEQRAAENARVQAALDQQQQAYGQLDLQAADLQGDMAQQLSQLGAAERAALLEQSGLLREIGDEQRNYEQVILDRNQEDWLRQQYYPQEQLSQYSDILRGHQRGMDTTQMQLQAPTSTARELLGLGITGLSSTTQGCLDNGTA